VAVARNTGAYLISGRLAPRVTRARQNRFEFAADQFFDELSRTIAHLDLYRIKPIIEKLGSRLGFTL
jgi:hypothetical protein